MRRIMGFVGSNRNFKAWLSGIRSGMVVDLALYRWKSSILKRLTAR